MMVEDGGADNEWCAFHALYFVLSLLSTLLC